PGLPAPVQAHGPERGARSRAAHPERRPAHRAAGPGDHRGARDLGPGPGGGRAAAHEVRERDAREGGHLLDPERGPGARDAPRRLQRAHRALRGARPRAGAPRAHRGGPRLPGRGLLLPRVAGGLARRLGRRGSHLRPDPRRRRAHPVRGGRARAAGGDRAVDRQSRHRGPGAEDGRMNVPVLELRGLRKSYGRFAAVKGLDLRVEAGEIFGFLGPNGAGKTTTIRMVAGVLRPSEGQVLVGGTDLESEPETAKARIGYIPDRPYLYDKLSGGEFLRFVAGLWGQGGAEADERAARLLELFDLTAWRDELIESYSHGMRQKLLI